ncbi:hypothetical protein NQ314_007397 [Rhamnusium bicolor]|uniref:Uncharacterized protein n=1 Tax=Rhamnusium bicolor TaxID=1586634 RepID=A0AAV8YMK8_9CUCU|nr:hypothetical protein NQ314_007397 [Rhamnusium bicolor]
MEDGWESHVSPLMMGVGMGEMQSMGEMQAHEQDIPGELNMPQHRQNLASHPDLNPDIHQDIEQDLGRDLGHHDMRSHHQDNLVGSAVNYYSHQVGIL